MINLHVIVEYSQLVTVVDKEAAGSSRMIHVMYDSGNQSRDLILCVQYFLNTGRVSGMVIMLSQYDYYLA